MLFFYFNVILYMDKEMGKCLLKGVVSMPTVQLTPNQSVALDNFTNEFEVINALADRNRQRSIVLLCENLKDGLTVTEITDRMSITQPAVSHHLKILREAGLVNFKKNGLQSVYFVSLDEPLSRLETVIHDLRTKITEE